MQLNRIFITGATGFIGAHLAPALLAQGYELAALYRNQVPPQSATSWSSSVTWIRIDEIQARLSAFRPNAVIHLATEYGDPEIELAQVVETNIRLPLATLETTVAAGCTVFINTDSFFGKPSHDYPHMPAYIQSKAQFLWWANQYLVRFQKDYRFINMRLEHVYGPYDGPKKFTTFLFDSLRRNATIPLTSGLQRRDFIYVGDVVAAYLHVLQHKLKLPVGFTELEVGTGQALALEVFVRMAKAVLGSDSSLNFGALPQRDKEIMTSQADTAGLRKLSWQATTDLEEGIRLSVNSKVN